MDNYMPMGTTIRHSNLVSTICGWSPKWGLTTFLFWPPIF